MSRRVTLPTADDLFRPTAAAEKPAVSAVPDHRTAAPQQDEDPQDRQPDGRAGGESGGQRARQGTGGADKRSRRSSGRVRHDEKMTVYVTAEELLDLEHARLAMRRDHGVAVDRGRLVREAIAIVLADLDQHGEDSDLVKRLGG